MKPRLATSVLVGALRRKVEGEGGFATLLATGDATAGALLLVIEERGAEPCVLERILQPNGEYGWQRTGIGGDADSATLKKFLDRRRKFDPDLWILELSVPSIERFVAESIAFD